MDSVNSPNLIATQVLPGATASPPGMASGKEVTLSAPDSKATVQDHQEPLPLDSLPESIRKRIIGRHCANPHIYDYLHRIELNADHSAELLDGGGQCLNSVASCQWALSKSPQAHKYTLSIIDPKEVRENLRHAPEYHDFKVDFKIITEPRTFELRSFNRQRPTPTMTCFSRLVFDADPLKLLLGSDDKPGPVNLFDVLEKDCEFLAREREYYAMDDAINDHQ